MATTVNWKDILDKPEWRPLAPCYTYNGTGRTMCSDLRKGADRDPFIYHYISSSQIEWYSPLVDEWGIWTGSYTGGITAAGVVFFFAPSQGPSGTVGASPNASYVTLAALPNSASIQVNQLANKGNGVGYRIRIYGSGTGGSGKTEERTIIANTAGATPTVYFDSPLSFTPTVNDKYEVLSGRLYVSGSGTVAAGFFRCIDIATKTVSGNLSVTNLPAVIGTESIVVMLDEAYVPYTNLSGEGMLCAASGVSYNGAVLRALQATASAAGTLTGHATNGDAGVLINEYARFQIRIVEDTGTPTSVGQRRQITSHTAGPSAVYTLASNWTVTPSSTAKFVIENCGDAILWTGTNTVSYSYAAGGFRADANWSTAAVSGGATQIANPPISPAGGNMAASCFSIVPDSTKQARQSHIMWWRGSASNTLYHYDFAANSWSSAYPTDMQQPVFDVGSCCQQDPAGLQGRYVYISRTATQRMFRYDLLNRRMEPYALFPIVTQSTNVGSRMGIAIFQDGSTYISFLHQAIQQTSYNNWYDIALLR